MIGCKYYLINVHIMGRMMRAGTKARGETLRTALIDAAERRLTDAGLAALSVRQLAADTDCGAGTIGYLFGSLDQLILRANERTLRHIADRLDAALRETEGADTARRMEALALAYLDYAQTHRHRWEALFLHRLPVGEPVPDWYAAHRDALIGRIADALGDSAASRLSPATAQTIFEAVQGVVMLGLDQKLGEDADAPLRDRVQLLIRLLANGLPAIFSNSL
jgi:AcrR family transcriptional regulator